jgi:hypothetical protein
MRWKAEQPGQVHEIRSVRRFAYVPTYVYNKDNKLFQWIWLESYIEKQYWSVAEFWAHESNYLYL